MKSKDSGLFIKKRLKNIEQVLMYLLCLRLLFLEHFRCLCMVLGDLHLLRLHQKREDLYKLMLCQKIKILLKMLYIKSYQEMVKYLCFIIVLKRLIVSCLKLKLWYQKHLLDMHMVECLRKNLKIL